jgi:hypothetical protein
MNTLEKIRAIDPCAGREPDAERLDAALERVVAMPAPAGRRARHARHARRAAVALAGAACLTAAGLAVSSGDRVAPASAAVVLREAQSAALQLDRPGPWTVVITRDWRNEPPGPPVPYLTETWGSDDGQQLSRVTRGAPANSAMPPNPLDGKLIRRDTAGFGPTVAEIRAYPTDPAALAQKLGRDVVQRATALLLSPEATPELRAALYGVLLRTPGAELIPRLSDPEGRTGEGVRFVKPNPPEGTDAPGGYDMTLLFDPDTHALLGLRQAGRPDSWDVVLRVERVRTAPRPDLEERMKDGRPEFVPVR